MPDQPRLFWMLYFSFSSGGELNSFRDYVFTTMASDHKTW